MNAKIPILTYHGVVENPQNKYNIPADKFKAQMSWLHASNYMTFAFGKPEEFPDSTARPLCVLTFDDGHKSNFDIVMPILEEHGYKAIFFINAGFIGKRGGFIDWDDALEMQKRGHSIQSHGCSHRFLNRLSAKDAAYEFQESRTLIHKNIHTLPLYFSCPGGRYNEQAIKIAKETGYRRMFTSSPRYYEPQKDKESFLLGRFLITGDMTLTQFKKIMDGNRLYVTKLKAEYYLKKCVRKFWNG